MKEVYYNHKQIFITSHVVKRARERGIAFPDQVYKVLTTGKVYKFGKNSLKFVSRSKNGSIICVGEDLGSVVLIKTIERGN